MGCNFLTEFFDINFADQVAGLITGDLFVFAQDGRVVDGGFFNEIVENRDTFGADPFLDLTLPSDGRYVVKVHDVVFAGSNDYPYRLTLHDGPHLDAISPVVAAPGVPATFTLIGRNLGGLPAPELSVDGRPVERKQVTIAPPAALELDPTHPSPSLVSSSAAVRRGFEYALTTPAGTSNRLFIAEAIDPVVIEEETNNDNEHPQEVTVPCDISGSFGAPNDVDIYRFKAKKGDVFWIEASADRLGSAADPAFLVQRVVEKAPPQDLLTGEDLPDQGGAGRFNTRTVAAGMRWPVPDDGIYQVVVSDLYSSQRGDPRLVYRLNIRPERPDFRVFLVPNAPNLIDSLTLRAGGRASAYVVAWRTDGFAGPIRVEARDLPPGVSCPPVVIAAGQAIAPIVFEAAEDAKRHIGLASLVATGHWGDRKEALTYVAGATPNGPPVSHEVLTGGMSWPPLNAQAPTVTPARLTRGFVLTILDPAPLTVTATPATWTVAQGHQLNLDLAITRREGLTEAVAVTASDLPPNLVNATATIAKEAKAATLPLFVAKTVPPGTYTFVLRATAPFPFSKDPNAKPKPNVNLSEPSNPITIVVRPAPVSLAVNNKGGALKAGAVLEVDVTVTRPAGYTDPVTLSLAAPAALKLSAPSVVIPTGQTTGKLVVTAAADSPPGAAAAVAVRATAPVRMEPVEVDEPLVLTISK